MKIIYFRPHQYSFRPDPVLMIRIFGLTVFDLTIQIEKFSIGITIFGFGITVFDDTPPKPLTIDEWLKQHHEFLKRSEEAKFLIK